MNPAAAQAPAAGAPAVATLSLADAVEFLNGRQDLATLTGIETFFLKRLMEDLDPEEKAECYFYLLRCRLKRSTAFGDQALTALYAKVRDAFRRAEQNYLAELRKSGGVVAREQLRAFYKIAIYHFSSLETLFEEHNFDESARHANEEKMEYRRRSYIYDRKLVHTVGYTLVGLTSRYGNSFVRWGITTLFSIAFFASLYFLVDAGTAPEQRIIAFGDPLFEYLYFSIVTFMTLGYGDIHPHTVAQMSVASFEVVMGYFMLGVLINMMNRRD